MKQIDMKTVRFMISHKQDRRKESKWHMSFPVCTFHFYYELDLKYQTSCGREWCVWGQGTCVWGQGMVCGDVCVVTGNGVCGDREWCV